MSNNQHTLVPEALRQRPDLPHNRYQSGSLPMDISGVSVTFGSATKAHTYSAPTGEGDVSRRLRRFALTLTRFQLPKAKALAKRWGVTDSALTATTNIITAKAFAEAFGDDATKGTINPDVLISLLNEPNPKPEVFMKAFSFIDTGVYQQILNGITNPEQMIYMRGVKDDVISHFISGWRWSYIKDINSLTPYRRKEGKRCYKYLAAYLDHKSNDGASEFSEAQKSERKGKKQDGEAGRGKAQVAEGDGWFPLFVSKPDLPLNHTGKLGRREIACDEGSVPKYLTRWVTDPERRIYSRKTKSLGAVVVMDCSGSMSLSERDLQQLMDNTAGATVLCYSTGNRADEEHPNAWIVARKNRQVRRLPDFPGGNGCDAPALRYALTLRDTTKQPIVWVTDYGVTGKGDYSNDDLINECKALVKRHGIIVQPDIRSAIKKLTQLQGKA